MHMHFYLLSFKTPHVMCQGCVLKPALNLSHVLVNEIPFYSVDLKVLTTLHYFKQINKHVFIVCFFICYRHLLK